MSSSAFFVLGFVAGVVTYFVLELLLNMIYYFFEDFRQ